MMSSRSGEPADVARYFDRHAVDFDSIYEQHKSWLRSTRDRLSRGTVIERLAFVDELVQGDAGRVLDVGCGSGRFSVLLAQRGWDAVGLDFAPEMVSLAQRRAASAGVTDRCSFLQEDFLTWDSPSPFDLALAIGVFDYVADPDPLLAKLAQVSDGQVVASFPRRLHPLVPLRWVRLRLSGCPVHFYSRQQVVALGDAHVRNPRVLDFHRDFLLLGDG